MGVMIFRDCPEKKDIRVWITNGKCDESKKCLFFFCSFYAKRTIKENGVQELGSRRRV